MQAAVTFDWRLTVDTERIDAICQAALAGTPPGMVRPDTPAHFAAHCGAAGHMLGCFLDTGEMIAYGVLGLRSAAVDDLAGLLGAEQARFCILDGAAALPQWRGFGLHNDAIARRLAYAAARGLTQVGATCAPENIRSVRALLRAGMAVRGFAPMYGGLPRLLLLHDGQAKAPPPRATSVFVTDHASHQAALARGLSGTVCRQDEQGRWLVDYG